MNMLTESFVTRLVDPSSHSVRNSVDPARMLERHAPPLLLLDVNGFIQNCGHSVEELFGYSQHELLWQHISCLFPKLGEMELVQNGKLNPMLNYICHCDHLFEAISKQSDISVCNLNFFMVEQAGVKNLRLIVRPVEAAHT